jgi:hypothetical protein
MNRNGSSPRISRGSKDFAGHCGKFGACERPHRFLGRPGIERLEPRRLLSGWASLTLSEAGQPVDTASTMLLLSDGSVMVQGGGISNNWYELTPDNSAATAYVSAVDAQRYAHGSFTTLAQSAYQRQYYASDMLPNGDLLAAGGEYALPLNPDDTYPTNKVELYDPVANTWTQEDDFTLSGQTDPYLGDVPSEVLADGTVLFGEKLATQTEIFDPSQPSGHQWVASPSLVKDEVSGEQSWVKLPDGSIVTTAVAGVGRATVAERFNQGATVSQDQWVEEGPAIDGSGNPIQLWNTSLGETGPGVLLSNGQVFFIGGAGETALYTPSSNSWTDGPEMLDSQGHVLGANDAPAALLPNGDVIFAAGPNDSYGPPCFLLQYDPSTNQISMVNTANGPDFFSTIPYQLRMLSLPDGSVLISDQTSQLWIYTPDAPTAAQVQQSAPTVTAVIDRHSSAGPGYNGNWRLYTLSGLRLNGMSEGAYYGDDAQMASNYPIVTLTDASGVVHFAHTHSWSSTGVETPNDTTIIATEFDSDVAPGVYLLSVSAGGISSQPYLFVKFSDNDNAPESATLMTSGGQTIVSGTYSATFAGVGAPQIAGILVDGAAFPTTSDTVTLDIPAGYGAGGVGFINVSGGNYHTAMAIDVALDGETVSFTDGSSFSVNGTPVTCANVQSLEFDADSATSTIAGSNAPNTIPLILNIASGAVLALAQTHPADSVMLQVSSLIIALDSNSNPLGQLDLGDNGMYLNYGSVATDPMSTIFLWLKSGYNGGAWNGLGIITSAGAANPNHNTAIGYADWADGRGVDTTANSIELKYALSGDTNLNGNVNSADLQTLLANFNTSGAVWDTGDFNYDTSCNSADLQMLLYDFNTSGP